LHAFESTALWRSTLAARPDDPHDRDREHLRSAFLRARDNVGVLLSELGPGVPEYTVHDLTHADALWETASLLVGDEITVNPVEGFVLGMAFLLHDAAMGTAAYREGPAEVLGPDAWRDLLCLVFHDREDRWPTDAEVDSPPAEVTADAVSLAVREAHARKAGELVTECWRSDDGSPYFLLDDARLRDWYGSVLADLVESHWWSVEQVSARFQSDRGSPPWLPDWTLDPLKLACLLRLADATQIDARRAPTLLILLRRPTGESRLHWRFQQYVDRPQRRGDRIRYTSAKSFTESDAAAWWLAYDYLRGVDRELRAVDDLMHDLDRPRFAARGVAHVGTPARFAEVFEVRGWRPVDADVRVSDVNGLVAALGGEQLYGRQPAVAVRELIQNAQDAVLARRAMEPGFEGRVDITLTEDGGRWILTVRDDGVGMDEDLLTDGLMDFGSSGWRSRSVRQKFGGLISGGFRPKGRFGIGFFSVFMLGDEVDVTSRRYDLARADARRLSFTGPGARPLLTFCDSREASIGTSISVVLKTHPQDRAGILNATRDGRLSQLVQRLLPESAVRVVTLEADGEPVHLPPFDVTSADAGAVFDRLYPPATDPRGIENRLRAELRSDFVDRATEVSDTQGRRVGLGLIGADITRWYVPHYFGVVTINGMAADHHDFFTGYLSGRPGRASRDNAELASESALESWLAAQEKALRQAGAFTLTTQLELADMLVRAGVRLSEDHHIAVIHSGPLTIAGIREWSAGHDEVFISAGWPIGWSIGGPEGMQLFHARTKDGVTIPTDWIVPMRWSVPDRLDESLADRRDPGYSWARFDVPKSWQRYWWEVSDDSLGVLLTTLAESWSCTVGDVLSPPAERNWSDTAVLVDVDGRVERCSGLWLRRPG
jgi:hypothetical protein